MTRESDRCDRRIRTLQAIGFALATLFVSVQSANAQWNPSPSPSPNTNIYYNAGNVGIGTAAPATSLDVNNVVRISPFSPNTSGSYINAGAALRLMNGNIYQSGGSETSSIQFGGMYNPSGTQTEATYNYIDWSAGWLLIRNNQQTKIQIGAGDEWGRQDIYLNPSAGNVGIGTTSPQQRLSVNYNTSNALPGMSVSETSANGSTGLTVNNTNTSTSGTPSNSAVLFNVGNANKGRIKVDNNGLMTISGGGISNDLVVNSSGNVGIGTTSPGHTLHVQKVDSSGAGILLTSGSSSAGGFTGYGLGRTNVDATWAIASQSNDWITGSAAGDTVFGNYGATKVHLITSQIARLTIDGSGNVGIGKPSPTVALDVVGSINLTGTVNAKYQDVAEWVPSSEQLSAGTVVVLDSTKSNQVTSSSVSYDTRVAGVVSEQPGIALGEKSDSKVLVATTGRVKVKVDASRGAIHIGDLLVTSDIPGVAMKSEPVNLGGVQIHRPGTLIGKALEPLEKGKGEILVLLSLQ